MGNIDSNEMSDFDYATLQSTHWLINAAYNQRSLQSTPLFTAWFNHQIWGQYTCVTFGARTFSTEITLIVLCVDYLLCCPDLFYLAGHIDGYKWNAAIDVAPAAQVEGEEDGDQVLGCAQDSGETHHLY
jgi:hypothetical protein